MQPNTLLAYLKRIPKKKLSYGLAAAVLCLGSIFFWKMHSHPASAGLTRGGLISAKRIFLFVPFFHFSLSSRPIRGFSSLKQPDNPHAQPGGKKTDHYIEPYIIKCPHDIRILQQAQCLITKR